MKETQTTQKSKQFLWKRTNQSEHIYWSLKRVARNLLPIRKQRERGKEPIESNWKMNKRTKTNRIGLFSFLNRNKRRHKNKNPSSLFALAFYSFHSFGSLFFSSEDVCVCVKVQLLLLELMYDSSIAGATVFIRKLFPFAFLDSFVLLLLFFVLRKLLVSFNFKHSFVIVVEFLLALCIFSFVCFFCAQLFRCVQRSLCGRRCVRLSVSFEFLFITPNSTRERERDERRKSLRLAFNNWVGNFQLLIFIVSLSSSFAHMCAIVRGCVKTKIS